jgi:hypothetical protein
MLTTSITSLPSAPNLSVVNDGVVRQRSSVQLPHYSATPPRHKNSNQVRTNSQLTASLENQQRFYPEMLSPKQTKGLRDASIY